MLKKGIYVLFLVLAQIAFAQEEDLCIDQPPEESYAEEHAARPHFTMYYNPVLNHDITPFWKHLRKIYNKYKHDHLRMIRIDCTSREYICIRQNITHYPTFRFFRGGEIKGITFHGEVDITSLTAFIDEQLDNTVTMGDE